MKLLRITTVPISLQKLLQGQPQYMMQNGIEVVLASAEGKEIPEIEKTTGLKVHTLPLTRKISPFTDLRAVWYTYKLIKKEKPDIVHTHTPKAGLVGMLAAKLAGVPIRMHTVAGLPLMQTTGLKRKVLNTVERLTSWAATGIYPNSQNLAQFMMEHNLAPAHKIKVLANGSSNGIDTNFFNPEQMDKKTLKQLQQRLTITENDFVFLFVGRLVGDKGINELVKAFTNLQESFPNIKLLLVGNEEPDLDPLKKDTLTTIQHNSNIITTGWVDDVRPFMAIANLLVFPSYREGFPNVVLQAGAMGLPAIVTNINGCNEIVTNGYNGLIVPVRSEVALKHAMSSLLKKPKNYKQMALNARPVIERNYKQDVVWKALLEAYRQLYRDVYE